MNYEEREFLKFADELKGWFDTPKAYILIPEMVELLKETCDKLRGIIEEERLDCQLEIHPCPLGFGNVIITFTTYSFMISDIERFYDAVRCFRNFEIYALDNGYVKFDGVFPKIAIVTVLGSKRGEE